MNEAALGDALAALVLLRRTCPAEATLGRLLEPDFPESLAAQLRDHLIDCPVCMRKWRQLRRLFHPPGRLLPEY